MNSTSFCCRGGWRSEYGTNRYFLGFCSKLIKKTKKKANYFPVLHPSVIYSKYLLLNKDSVHFYEQKVALDPGKQLSLNYNDAIANIFLMICFLPFDVLPFIARLFTKNFLELFDSISFILKWCVLVLSNISNATPTCEKNIYLLAWLTNQLRAWYIIYFFMHVINTLYTIKNVNRYMCSTLVVH